MTARHAVIRCRAFRTLCGALILLTAMRALAACSAIDSYQYMKNLEDPREGLFRHVDKPVPGTDQPYPNLASVPAAPAVTPSPERAELQKQLAADAKAGTYQPNPREVPSVPAPPPPLPPGFISAQKPMQLPPASPVSAQPQQVASAATLPGTPPAFGAPRNPQQVAIVLFDAGSTKIDASQAEKLKPIIRMLRQQGRLLRVVGHASRSADARDRSNIKISNFDLSLDRANAVARILTQLGAQPAELVVSGEGDSTPVDAIAGVAGEAANRRVDIYLE